MFALGDWWLENGGYSYLHFWHACLPIWRFTLLSKFVVCVIFVTTAQQDLFVKEVDSRGVMHPTLAHPIALHKPFRLSDKQRDLNRIRSLPSGRRNSVAGRLTVLASIHEPPRYARYEAYYATAFTSSLYFSAYHELLQWLCGISCYGRFCDHFHVCNVYALFDEYWHVGAIIIPFYFA
jgi:hypothetical protein